MSTSKKLARSLKLSPPVAAVLALADPQERAAFELLRRFCTGRWPLWRLLGLRRDDDSLCVAVKWCRSRGSEQYSVARLSLKTTAIWWRYFPSATAARQALMTRSGEYQAAQGTSA